MIDIKIPQKKTLIHLLLLIRDEMKFLMKFLIFKILNMGIHRSFQNL